MTLQSIIILALGISLATISEAKEELCLGKVTRAKSIKILDGGKSISLSSEDENADEYVSSDENTQTLSLTSFNEYGSEKISSVFMNGEGFSIVLQKVGASTSVNFQHNNGQLTLLKKISDAQCVDPNEAYSHEDYID